MSNEQKASKISYQACNMYPKKTEIIDGFFLMYSHDRFSSLIIQGVSKYLLDQGCTEEEVKYALCHKAIRWSLDADEEMLQEFGKEWAKEHEIESVAKEEREVKCT